MRPPKSVKLANRANKELSTIPLHYRRAIQEALDELAGNPLLGKLLAPPFPKGSRRHKVVPYRIIYTFDESTLTVINIQHRKDVYR